MTENQGQMVYRSLHAPKASGEALIEPPIDEFAKLVLANYSRIPASTRNCWGAKSLQSHRFEAQNELRGLFANFPSLFRPAVMVGHQPHLFHPGVWMKNVVAARAAKLASGFAVNLIVDNDLMKAASIAVPSQQGEGAISRIEFDESADEMPFEERNILNPELATAFTQRCTETMPNFNSKLVLKSFWEKTTSEFMQSPNWGGAISAGRNAVERDWDVPVLDVRLSQIVGTVAFARLVLEIAHDSIGFARTYNSCLAEYREVHGLRSRSHPAPDLEIISETEVELPFWLWTTNSPHRQRTFLRRSGNQFTITDRESIEWSANFESGESLLERVVKELLSPTTDPHRPKLRPKALITTLYARLLLCDGFVHGIGGAKYDQVTEAIAARWGLGTLAPMQCATMTLRLPLPMEIVSIEEVRHKKRKLRDLVYHPEIFIAEASLRASELSKASALALQKKEWIARAAPDQLKERHQRITALNAELSGMLGDLRTQFEADYHAAQQKYTQQQPWLSREFASVLFPEDMLRSEFARVTSE